MKKPAEKPGALWGASPYIKREKAERSLALWDFKGGGGKKRLAAEPTALALFFWNSGAPGVFFFPKFAT